MRTLLLFPTTLILLATATAGHAADYCVTCIKPDKTYTCRIEAAGVAARPSQQDALQCIERLAKSGGHETCSVSKAQAQPCTGVIAVMEPPQLDEPPAPALATPATAPPATAVDAPPATEPKTVQDLAGKTIEQAKEGLKNASDTVGSGVEKAGKSIGSAGTTLTDTVKKSWHCVTSLFGDC